jgi:hypothetical protein
LNATINGDILYPTSEVSMTAVSMVL